MKFPVFLQNIHFYNNSNVVATGTLYIAKEKIGIVIMVDDRGMEDSFQFFPFQNDGSEPLWTSYCDMMKSQDSNWKPCLLFDQLLKNKMRSVA